jgi:2'-5' RNA ligase
MNTAPENVRLFVACEVPDEVKDGISNVIEQLKNESVNDVRFIKPEGVHITLKFLGEVPVKKLPAVKLAIQEAVVGHSPYELELSTIGTFGGREGLRIMWVGVAGDVLRLEALVRSVNAALKVVGFEPERRPFRPHLTLGRVKDDVGTRRRAEIEVAVGKTVVPPISWRTAQVSLMRSRLTTQGVFYDLLATFPLRVSAPAGV